MLAKVSGHSSPSVVRRSVSTCSCGALAPDQSPWFNSVDARLFMLPKMSGCFWCVVSDRRDAILSTEDEKTLWQPCFTAAPEQRREFEPNSKGLEKSPAPWPIGMG